MGKIAVAGPAQEIKRCPSKEVIIKNGGQVVLNDNGTVGVFYNDPKTGLYPVPLNLYCCKSLDKNYYFDINTQTCRWSEPKICGFGEPINLIVNPKGNDGSLFYVDISDNENCSLKISFDYLLKVKCEDLNNLLNPTISSQSLETQQQIHDIQVKIQEINTEIESVSNNIYTLNQEYINTAYSINCDHYPVITTTPDPVNCMVSAWGPWSACVNGVQTHTRIVTTQAAYGGTACPPLTETQPCTVVAGPCVPPANMVTLMLGFQTQTTNFTSSQTAACDAVSNNLVRGWYSPLAVSLAVGNIVYNSATSCQRFPDGWYTVTGPNRTVHIVNGIIDSITPCPAPVTTCYSYSFYGVAGGTVFWKDCAGVSQSIFVNASSTYVIPCAQLGSVIGNGGITKLNACLTTAKMAAFDSSGFSPKSLTETIAVDTATLDTSVYQKGSVTTYTTVNLCLTDPYGLQLWASILGPTRYAAFILGDPTSYTCDDVYAINTNINAAQAVYSCDTPFGTKSQILVKINQLMTQLTSLNTQLTSAQDILIKLENDFTQSQTDGKGCKTPVDALEAMDVEMFLDIVTGTTNTLVPITGFTFFPKIGTGNLYNYLSDPLHANSGFYICGDPSKGDEGLPNCTTLSLNTHGDGTTNVFSCNSLIGDMMDQLFTESGLSDVDTFNQTIPNNALASQWLTYSTVVTDPAIIAAITNQKIKISFRIKYSCVDFCLLLDNLVLDKTCTHVDKTEIIIPQSPGFDFQRVIDNKKSWIDTTTSTERLFHIAKFDESNPIRQTDYNVNDERLVLNTKEIDLDISVASAIETDVWCYLNDNPCALTAACTSTVATTTNDPYIDGQTIVFSGTPITITDCTDYNSVLANRTPNFIQTTPCGTILRFKLKIGFPAVAVYYWIVQQPNGDVEFYYQDVTTFTNFSNVYQNGKDCCEYLNVDLKKYNDSVGVDDKMTVYWDEDCQRCKVEKSRCGDVNIDFHALVTQPISGVTTIEGFENLLTSELIDVKNRQTITAYPTLRALYERYLNSSGYCSTNSSAFTYESMDAFAGLVGNYWIDLIEQVVPSTTIWGSVKIYTNTIFDEQKFKYKSYSSLLCENPFIGEHVLSPINGVYGETSYPNVVYSNLIGHKLNSPTTRYANPNLTRSCDSLSIAQMNSGSEFISYIQIELPEVIPSCTDCNDNVIDLSGLGDFNLDYMVNNSDNTKMYVSSYEGHILVISTLTDTLTTTITTNPSGSGIRRIVYSPNNKLYAICNDTNNVIVINTLTDTIIGLPISVGSLPTQGIYVPYNGYLYVTNSNTNTVTVIDTLTDSVVTTITVGYYPYNMVYNPDLRVLYVTNITDGTISIIDVVANTVTSLITLGSPNNNLYLNYVAYNQHLYVYNYVDAKLIIINTVTNDIINAIGIDYGGEMTYNPSNKYLYLSTSNTMTIIDTTNDTIVATPSITSSQSIYASSTNDIYAGYDYGTLTTIDSSNTGVEVRNVPRKSTYAIFNPSNETIYVSSWNTITIFKCINNKPKNQTVIKECDLGVRIKDTLVKDVTMLEAITVGGTGPFTYLWSNGATTESINVTNSGNYSVKVTDTSTCCVATAQFEILKQKACWFVMPESPEYVMGSFYQDLYGVCDLNDYPLKEITFNVWDITINDYPITVSVPPLSTTMTPDTINWTTALNKIVYRCTPGNVTGQTYTNYVEFLNSVFNTLGLTGYKAQVSLKAQKVSDGTFNENNGFYIIYPENDTFKIKTESLNNTDKYIYSNTGISEWDPLYDGYNPWSRYGKSFCDGITVTNGKVIE